jgi:predicted alpha-1,2-mannosidase
MSRLLVPTVLILLAMDSPRQAAANAFATANVDQVNVMVGTAADGQTFPATGVPFAMTQWTPQTRAGEVKCAPPYYAADTRIQGFRATHFLSGSCAQDYGSFTIMPLGNDRRLGSAQASSAFSRATERASPYRYSVDLADSGIHADITGSERSGMMRFHFPARQKIGWISLENNLRLGTGTVRIDPIRQEISGINPVYRIYAGANQPAGFSGYIVLQFNHRFKPAGTWEAAPDNSAQDQIRHPGSLEQTSATTPGALVSFDLPSDETIEVRIGTSFTSIDEARRNLEAEMPDWDFDAAVARSRAAWSAALDSVQIAGSAPDRSIFYTALYHAMLLPGIYSDRDGSYPQFAGNNATEHAQGFTYYDDYSIWDTFRAVHPLLTILQPERDLDMVKSLIAKGEQGGFLPIFPAWNSYTAEMTGDHAGAIITDAYVKGIHGFDAEAAYRLMRKNATEEPSTQALYRDGRGRRALSSYLKYGYIPLEDHVPDAFHGDEQVSRTLDYAYDDFVLSAFARALGHTQDADLFARRAQNYRNVIDPAAGFARGRHADGSWVTPFDPATHASWITEATPYEYTFFVPQDIPGLINLLHGPKAFVAKLDSLFDGGPYDQGNEPAHHIAYLYDDAGVPAKTQLRVHDIMVKDYRNAPDGLIGNDDAGQMSAWYVISALGFYAVTPGTPRYSIGTPHFNDLTLNVGHGRQLHIQAKGAESGKFYIHSIRLNGTLINRTYLLHSEIIRGGQLVFEMSDHPNADNTGD